MNDLLFALLIIALLYYFFVYLPQQQKNLPLPVKLTQNQNTQTDLLSTENKDLETTIDHLIASIRQLNHQLK